MIMRSPVENFGQDLRNRDGQLAKLLIGLFTVLYVQRRHPGFTEYGQRHSRDLDPRKAL
jgi:hypothetical protein